jgi:outer membrane lipoprotein-sorting protein
MKNLKNSIITLVCVVFVSGFAQAQTADEIVNKYFEAIGGKDKWRTVKSMLSIGKAPSPQGEFSMKVYQKAPNKMKLTIDLQGMEKAYQCFDGEVAWGELSNANMQAEKMGPEETAEMKDDAVFEDKLLDYAKKGHSVALEGKETIEGTECFKIKFTEKNGDISYYFMDTENYVPIMLRTAIKMGPAKGELLETYMSDYKEVDGLMIAHATDTRVKGQSQFKVQIDTIKLNTDIDDKTFAYPGK